MAKKNEHKILIAVSPEMLNAINNFVLADVRSRQEIFRDMITDYLTEKGFPSELTEKVRLRKRDYSKTSG